MRGEGDGPLAALWTEFSWRHVTGYDPDDSATVYCSWGEAWLWEQDARYRAAENERLRWMLEQCAMKLALNTTHVLVTPNWRWILSGLDRRYREREG